MSALERLLLACLECRRVDVAVTMLSNAEELDWPMPPEPFMRYFIRKVEQL